MVVGAEQNSLQISTGGADIALYVYDLSFQHLASGAPQEAV
jgi:hypothetical protein